MLNIVILVNNSFSFFFNVHFERESMSRGGAEREEDTESEAGSRLWAVSTEPDAGLELTNREIMTWANVGHLTDCATQAPLLNFFLMFTYFWERETETERDNRGAERDRICSRLQALSCQHRARCRAQTHKLWDHDLSQSWMLNRLSHPGTPQIFLSF